MKISGISISEIQHVAHSLAKELMAWDEPIPDFGTRYPDKLESCVAVPFQTWDKKLLHKGLISKVSVLFYLMIKNHPFQNGNKRIAVATMFYFMYKNGKWLTVDNQSLYNFAKWIAASDPMFKDEAMRSIEKFVKTNIKNLD